MRSAREIFHFCYIKIRNELILDSSHKKCFDIKNFCLITTVMVTNLASAGAWSCSTNTCWISSISLLTFRGGCHTPLLILSSFRGHRLSWRYRRFLRARLSLFLKIIKPCRPTSDHSKISHIMQKFKKSRTQPCLLCVIQQIIPSRHMSVLTWFK